MKLHLAYAFNIGVLLFIVLMTTPVTATATRLNNSNWFTESHPKPVSFSLDQNGAVTGSVSTGAEFKQFRIYESTALKVDRFEIQDHYHYIANGVVLYSDAELALFIQDHT